MLCITPHYVLYRSCVLHLMMYCIIISSGTVCIMYCTPSILCIVLLLYYVLYSFYVLCMYYIVFVPHYFLYVLAKHSTYVILVWPCASYSISNILMYLPCVLCGGFAIWLPGVWRDGAPYFHPAKQCLLPPTMCAVRRSCHMFAIYQWEHPFSHSCSRLNLWVCRVCCVMEHFNFALSGSSYCHIRKGLSYTLPYKKGTVICFPYTSETIWSHADGARVG